MLDKEVTGRKYRILVDKANDIWDRISFWTRASDVYYDDDSSAQDNQPVNMLKRATEYKDGDIAYTPFAPSWVMLRCTRDGMTARSMSSALENKYRSINSVGSVIDDGEARFMVCDIRPTSTASTSQYQIPSMKYVNDIKSQLTTTTNSGTIDFQFAYEGGNYGYMIDSTFMPFSGFRIVYENKNDTTGKKSGTITLDTNKFPDASTLTDSDFVVIFNPKHGSSGTNAEYYEHSIGESDVGSVSNAVSVARYYCWCSYNQSTHELKWKVSLSSDIVLDGEDHASTRVLPFIIAVWKRST